MRLATKHITAAVILTLFTVATVSLTPTQSVVACAGHPEIEKTLVQLEAVDGKRPTLPDLEELHAMGISTPTGSVSLSDIITDARSSWDSEASPSVAVPFRVLLLLVDFSDQPASTSTEVFDTLMFGTTTGSIRHYYDEISYSQIDLVTLNMPSTVGWVRAPQPYSYYVDDQYGMYGTYPRNSQGMVSDLIDAVDSLVDFSNYDNDSDGYVDVVVVAHTGTGAELSAQTSDIWSHKWGLYPARSKDGVYIQNYTVQPEYWYSPGDMTIGVYCHELGHAFGLPDLYDTDNSSNGIGKWGIMAYGSWNGSLGDSPAHPSAWSRIEMGFASPQNVATDLTQRAISSVNDGGSIYKLWTSGVSANEFFLIENRRRTGYDSDLPGDGLLIWHVDESESNNNDEWYPGEPASDHYLVALEQADGLFQLEQLSGNFGGASDAFPGSGYATTFNSSSMPNSDSYTGGATPVSVDDISASDSTMYADLVVGVPSSVEEDEEFILPTQFELSQNYPNPFNPTTTIEFTVDKPSLATLEVINLNGQKIKTLIDSEVDEGTTTVAWDATDNSGSAVASGLYFYRLVIDETEEQSKKMILLR